MTFLRCFGSLLWIERLLSMSQHPRLSLPLVKQWHRQALRDCDIEAVEELLVALIPIDATLVRHGRTDQARALRKAVMKIIEG